MSGIVLARHELLWVLEQCGSTPSVSWPYPLRPVHWSAETDADTSRHRDDTERRLRDRGLLEPAPARLLLDAGRAVTGWVVAVDMVRRDADLPRAAVALTDGRTAALLDSPEHADAPVRLTPCPPGGLVEALMTLVPPAPPDPVRRSRCWPPIRRGCPPPAGRRPPGTRPRTSSARRRRSPRSGSPTAPTAHPGASRLPCAGSTAPAGGTRCGLRLP